MTTAPRRGARNLSDALKARSLHYNIVFSANRHRRVIAEPWRQELHAYCEPQANVRRRICRSVAFKRRRWKVAVVKHPGAPSGAVSLGPVFQGCARFTRLPPATFPARLRLARQLAFHAFGVKRIASRFKMRHYPAETDVDKNA